MGEHGIRMAMYTGQMGKAEDKSEWLGAPILGSMGTTARTPTKREWDVVANAAQGGGFVGTIVSRCWFASQISRVECLVREEESHGRTHGSGV